MGTTAPRGYPWPDNTARVADGWDAIRDLAEAVDDDMVATLAALTSGLAGKRDKVGSARAQGSSAGAQWDAGGSQWFYSLGFSWTSVFVLQVFTIDGFGNYVPVTVPIKAITPGNGTIYYNNDGNTSNGLVRQFRVIDQTP